MQIFTFIFLPSLPARLNVKNSSRNKTSKEEKDQRGELKEADSPATELGRGMRYRGMEWAEWEDMLSRVRSGILLRL